MFVLAILKLAIPSNSLSLNYGISEHCFLAVDPVGAHPVGTTKMTT